MKIDGMIGKTGSRGCPIVQDYMNCRASKRAEEVFDAVDPIKKMRGAQMKVSIEEINDLRIGNEHMLDIWTIITSVLEGHFASMKISFQSILTMKTTTTCKNNQMISI